MKTLNILVLLMCIFSMSCTQPIEPSLKGEIVNNNEVQHIKLVSVEDGYKVLDSIEVKGRSFSFNPIFKSKKLLQIRTNDFNIYSMLFFYEPELKYKLHIENNGAVIEAPVNSVQHEYNVLLKKLNPLNEKLSEVSQDTSLTKEELNNLSSKYYRNLLDEKKSYIQKHPESYVSLYLLKDIIDRGSSLSYHELSTFFNMVNIDVHKESYMLDFISDELKNMEEMRMVGNSAPAFSLKTPTGKVYTLEDFKGGYTLIDFWASWCAPCRVANRKIIPLYEKYKDRGFNIVSISFDEDREKWIKAIEEDQIPWPQVSDLKGFYKSEIKDLYNVEQLPTTYLIDSEGNVVDQHLKHEELEQLLEKIYSKK